MKHKCADCGFLAARNLDTRNLDEVEGEFRRSGNPPNEIIAGKEIGYYRHKRYPICFMQEYDLLDSFERTDGDESTKFLVVIGEDRQCEPFTEWLQGFTPKEHREMIDRERERRWHIFEIILISIVTLIAAIASAIVGALIATGKI